MAGIIHKQINLKKTSAGTYSIGWHQDWAIGLSLHGGHLAAALHLAAVHHLETELSNVNQPDILRLHFEFLRASELCNSTITVNALKIGAATSTLQLSLTQKGKLKILALATSFNFDKPVGPSAAMEFTLRPPPTPVPEFELAKSQEPQPHWIASSTHGEVLPGLRRLLMLAPRQGLPAEGIMDMWNHWEGDIPMDAFYLTLMADCFPSMADTLLGNKGVYDARKNHEEIVAWDKQNPGKPAIIKTTIAEALQAKTFNTTLTLDIEFKRRVPAGGISWLFTRLSSKLMLDGRLDLDISLCNEKMGLVATANQTFLVLDVARKFGQGKVQASL